MLTGEVSWVVPMTSRTRSGGTRAAPGEGFHHGFITLTVEPWVSADTVRRVYQEVQKGLLGGDNRPIGPKSHTLLSFVTEKVGPAPPLPNEKRRVGHTLVEEW